MQVLPRHPQHCFAASLLFPFSRILRRFNALPAAELDRLDAIDPEERIPISTVNELLRGAIALTGDLDLGLKAAREIELGDHGAVEYAARTAPTWIAATEALGRYVRLINDALRFSLHLEGARGTLVLESLVPLQRAAVDFKLGAFHISHKYIWAGAMPSFEVWFMHPRPHDVAEYELTFAGGALRFDAPFNGFTFHAELAEVPLPTADPKLHKLLRRHAEAMLAELPSTATATQRVRDLLAKELDGGTPALSHIAAQCGVSERTLGRQLEEENTSFKALLEDLRRRLALRYVGSSIAPMNEIAFLVGFSSAAVFHRAFRRWTGSTPLEYRRGVRSVGHHDDAASGQNRTIDTQPSRGSS